MHTERALFFDINRYFFLQLLLEKQITSIKQIFCSFLHFFRSVLARNSALALAFRQPWMPFCLVHSRRLCLEKRLINGLLLIQSRFQNIPNIPSIILISKSIHQWWIQGMGGGPSTPLLSGSTTATYHLSTSFPSQYTSNQLYIFQIWSVVRLVMKNQLGALSQQKRRNILNE